MSEAKQALFALWMLTVICISIVVVLLFVSLWEYLVWVGVSLLVLVFVVVGAIVHGTRSEQKSRIVCFRHKEETPLNSTGEPMFWHRGYQANQHMQS
jgi:cell division protein FtsW (lipid II flippase)